MVYKRKRKIPTSDESLIEKLGVHADFHEHTLEKTNTSSNHNELNKLLLLSEVCMVEISNQDMASGKLIAELCESQKDEVALKNKGKEPFSSGQKQGADNTPPSSSMNIIGQNQITPICSSQLKNDAASGSRARGEKINPRTSRRPLGFLKHTTKTDNWSELELDALWIGVRRYGQLNWTAILADPNMYILKKRTPQELATKWKAEILKIFPTVNNTVLPIPTTCANYTTNALGPGIGRFPFGVDNQALRSRWNNMFLSKNQGSAFSCHSIQRAVTATGNELKAIQTFAELNVSTRRQEGSTSTNVHQPEHLQ